MRRQSQMNNNRDSIAATVAILLVFVVSQSFTADASTRFARHNKIWRFDYASRILLDHRRHMDAVTILRGGSTTATMVNKDEDKDVSKAPSKVDDTKQNIDEKDKLRTYRLQQQLYLQSRSLVIRQALINRGLDELQFTVKDGTVATDVDWDCALATEKYPKSCLFSFDAETGSKVIAPVNTTEWISIVALNRLRRNDPSKVEPLWHTQYNILNTWFQPDSKYSLYTYLPFTGTVLTQLLDAPLLLGTIMTMVALVIFLITFPLWESVIQTIIMMPIVWDNWTSWYRWVHAALPLKLLLGQYTCKFIGGIASTIYNTVRNKLVELECQILQDYIPLTIIEEGKEKEEEEVYGIINNGNNLTDLDDELEMIIEDNNNVDYDDYDTSDDFE